MASASRRASTSAQLQQVEGDALGRLRTDAGQPTELVDQASGPTGVNGDPLTAPPGRSFRCVGVDDPPSRSPSRPEVDVAHRPASAIFDCIVERRQHEIFERLDVVGVDRGRIDRDGARIGPSGDGDRDRPSTRRTLETWSWRPGPGAISCSPMAWACSRRRSCRAAVGIAHDVTSWGAGAPSRQTTMTVQRLAGRSSSPASQNSRMHPRSSSGSVVGSTSISSAPGNASVSRSNRRRHRRQLDQRVGVDAPPRPRARRGCRGVRSPRAAGAAGVAVDDQLEIDRNPEVRDQRRARPRRALLAAVAVDGVREAEDDHLAVGPVDEPTHR